MSWRSHGRDNNDLVSKLKGNNVIKSDRVEQAMRSVDRGNYCPTNPYNDSPQRIEYQTTISAPHMHAHALGVMEKKLVEGARALDVGVGSGYLTACMAIMIFSHILPPQTGVTGFTVGIDHIKELNDQAIINIKKGNKDLWESGRVRLVDGDGRLGYSALAPYDVIHVGAAAEKVPQALFDQLKPGGRLIIPVGPKGGNQQLEQHDKGLNGVIHKTVLMGVIYVPLTDVDKQVPLYPKQKDGRQVIRQCQNQPPPKQSFEEGTKALRSMQQLLLKGENTEDTNQQRLLELQKANRELNRSLEESRKNNEELKQANQIQEKVITRFQDADQNQQQQIQELQKLNRELNNELNQVLEELLCKNQELEKAKQTGETNARLQEAKQREIQELERINSELNQNIEEIRRENEELQEIKHQLQQQILLQTQSKNPHWIIKREEVEITQESIGKGGWGEVKVAIFRGTRVAAKSLHEIIVSDYNMSIFSREMDISSRIRHPNLLQFIGSIITGNLTIILELMPTSLRKELEKSPITRTQVLSIARDVASALNYLHLWQPHPIIHRDVSSANVLLEPSGSGRWKAKVSDYGSANVLTQVNTVAPGSPAYSAPEALNPNLHSPAMDVYSFGVLFMEMILRRQPLGDIVEREAQVETVQWPTFKPIVQHCMKRDSKSRPTMGHVLQDLISM